MPSSKRLPLILFGTHLLAGLLFLSPSYIRPDSVAVHSWLRSIVVSGDFLFFDEWAGFGMLGSGFAYFKEVTAVGALANHWWIGTSIVTAPFFLVSHMLSVLLPGALFPTDGFFGLDLATLGWSSALFHALAMAFAWLAVRRIDEPESARHAPVIVALVFASLGTPAFWYAFRMPIGTHAAGMMLVGLLTFLCIRFDPDRDDGDRSWISLLLTGLTLGLAIATRIQHVVLVPAVLFAMKRRSTGERAVVGIGAAVPLLVQGAAWYAVYGTPFGPITAGANLEGVTWMPFHRISFIPVLFSSWRGLFVWSPVWAPALAGMFFLIRDRDSDLRRRAGVICLLMFGGELLANGTLDRYWWGGMSFGPRRFVDLTVPAAIGLWAFLRRTRLTGIALGGVATAWSCMLMLAATAGTVSLARHVTWSDLGTAVIEAGPSLTLEALRSPVSSAALAIQSLVAVLLIGVVSAILWRLASSTPELTARLALAWIVGCLLVALVAIPATRARAQAEAKRFNVTGAAARSAGPLIDQRGLIADELAWLEASGRRAAAARTRDEIARIDARLAELGVR